MGCAFASGFFGAGAVGLAGAFAAVLAIGAGACFWISFFAGGCGFAFTAIGFLATGTGFGAIGAFEAATGAAFLAGLTGVLATGLLAGLRTGFEAAVAALAGFGWTLVTGLATTFGLAGACFAFGAGLGADFTGWALAGLLLTGAFAFGAGLAFTGAAFLGAGAGLALGFEAATAFFTAGLALAATFGATFLAATPFDDLAFAGAGLVDLVLF